ncbi:hypothetical protein FOZ60_000751 [Perkinsus olseni]|uniref:Uncharacterized protein n=1 Tax=Perkinsus olseni TaxID=32597 RepID=A0A7J6P1M7_PEROL|nr:hypothetical protein FOZ60_000751 [Perkinsus olseni]
MASLSGVVSLLACIGLATEALEHGRYCGFQPILYNDSGPLLSACVQLHYYNQSLAVLRYDSYRQLNFHVNYDDVAFQGDKIILKRRGKEEGRDLFPFFNFKFELEVSNGTVQLQPYNHSKSNLTLVKDKCTPPKGVKAICSLAGHLRALAEGPDGLYLGERTGTNDTMHYSVKAGRRPPFALFRLFDDQTFRYMAGVGYLYLGQPDASGRRVMKLVNAFIEKSEELFLVAGVFRYDVNKNMVNFYPPYNPNPYIIGFHHNLPRL